MNDTYATLASLESYNKILVIGSCLAHDAAKALFREDANYRYIWRMSTPSMMSPEPASCDAAILEAMSSSERLTFERDVFKTPGIADAIETAEIIILDLVRDSYDFLRLENGAIITRGVEVEKYALEETLKTTERLRLGTLGHFEMWLEAIHRFAEMVRAAQKPIVVLRPRWMHLYLHEWRFSLVGDFDQFEIVRRNLVIGHYGRIMESLLGLPVALSIPDSISYADSAHPWGSNPLHLHAASIQDIVAPLRAAAETRSGFDRLRGDKEAAHSSESALRNMLSERILSVPRL
ncbi:hypothetical protein M2323_002855 [Rhodoblastus acidophilus]|uniref:DUF6270 domain-containing protein n=1 Tax=Rhodoblastus acidophilus TaxID=1074 RepID=UPI00222473F0|nr:DUF6270 domain-containing protein [Rhodoblastus acidophilus]MCW2285018.1 hypothetical protein [Rhodoblastus acidophilus]MCW2333918.1 hypothetical protein [Rhodoblastus acidophilus]